MLWEAHIQTSILLKNPKFGKWQSDMHACIGLKIGESAATKFGIKTKLRSLFFFQT